MNANKVLSIVVSEVVEAKDLFINAGGTFKKVVKNFIQKTEATFVENLYTIRGIFSVRGPDANKLIFNTHYKLSLIR